MLVFITFWHDFWHFWSIFGPFWVHFGSFWVILGFLGLSEKMEKIDFSTFRLFSGLTDMFEFIVMNDGIHHILA